MSEQEKVSPRGTYGDQKLLHLLYGSTITEPALWLVVVGIFAEAFLVAVDEPGIDAQNSL